MWHLGCLVKKKVMGENENMMFRDGKDRATYLFVASIENL
jgi:hypothetical protein